MRGGAGFALIRLTGPLRSAAAAWAALVAFSRRREHGSEVARGLRKRSPCSERAAGCAPKEPVLAGVPSAPQRLPARATEVRCFGRPFRLARVESYGHSGAVSRHASPRFKDAGNNPQIVRPGRASCANGPALAATRGSPRPADKA